MRMLIKALVFVGILAVGLVGIGFLLADEVHIERSASIEAPPATVFKIVNGFTEFDRWSPWADLDPAMTVKRSGPDAGVGARYDWAGNDVVGTGTQEITSSTPDSEVRMKLQFEGYERASDTAFVIKPEGTGSVVTWSMDSTLGSSPIDRYFGLFMDKMIGPDYEKGLGRLKLLAETRANEVAAPEASVDQTAPSPAPSPAAVPAIEASPSG